MERIMPPLSPQVSTSDRPARPGRCSGRWAPVLSAVIALAACTSPPPILPVETTTAVVAAQPATPASSPPPIATTTQPSTTIRFADGFGPVGWTPDGALYGLSERSAEVVTDATGAQVDMVWSAATTRYPGVAALSPDGRTLVKAGWTDRWGFWLWRLGRAETNRWTGWSGGRIDSFRFSPDGQMLAAGASAGTIGVWDLTQCPDEAEPCGAPLRTLYHRIPGETHAVFTPDGSSVASAGSDGTVRLWRVADGKLLRTFDHRPDYYTLPPTVAFSPNGVLIAIPGAGETLRIYRVDDGSLVYAFPAPGLQQPVWSPNGRFLAWLSPAGIHLAELGDEVVIHTQARPTPVTSLAFVAEGEQLAAIEPGRAVLWPISLLVQGQPHRPATLRASDLPDIRQETVQRSTLLNEETGGAYLLDLAVSYDLTPYGAETGWQAFTTAPVTFPSGAEGVLANIGYSGKLYGHLFLFRDEGDHLRLVDWMPGPNGLRLSGFAEHQLSTNLMPVDLFPPGSTHGQTLQVLSAGHAGLGLGENGFTLIEIAENELRYLFEGTEERWTMKIAEGDAMRAQFSYVDLDGDQVKEIIVEQTYCQLFVRNDQWREQFCDPFDRTIYRYDGVRFTVSETDAE